MAFAPLELNGIVSRTQDMIQIKQNQDNKALVDQANIQNVIKEETDKNAHQVVDADSSEEAEDLYDPRKEGRNKYQGQKKKKNNNTEGKIVLKNKGGFDISV